MIEVIKQLDNSHAFHDPLRHLTRTTQNQYQSDPIMINIKGELGELIYKKHYFEYLQSKSYSITHIQGKNKMIESDNIFEVKRDPEKNILYKTTRTVVFGSELGCTCNLLRVEGIICRHIFSVATILQVKDLSTYLHPRWRMKPDFECQKHIFSENYLGDLKKAEKMRTKKEEDDGERMISFKKIISAARKIGDRQEKKDSESQVSEENSGNEEEDERMWKSPELLGENEESKEECIRNFKKVEKQKGRKKAGTKRKGKPDDEEDPNPNLKKTKKS